MLAAATLLPLAWPARHFEDSGRFIDFGSLYFGWIGSERAGHVPCWPVILAGEAVVLIVGGIVLTWLARRPQGRQVEPSV